MLRRDEDIFWIIPLLVERVVVVDGHRLLQHRSLLFNSIDGESHRICKKCRRRSNKRILESLLSTSCWDEYSLPSISLESRGTSNSSEKRATKYIFIIITELKCAPWRTMFSRDIEPFYRSVRWEKHNTVFIKTISSLETRTVKKERDTVKGLENHPLQLYVCNRQVHFQRIEF